MDVISLFDGISCAYVALQIANIPIKSYTAFEIDKYAITISKKNNPTIIHKGDVCSLTEKVPCDILIGGSPCTDLSIAKVYLSVFPQDKAKDLLEAVKTNAPLIKHDLAQRVKLQLRKVPNLAFYIDDSLDYIEKIDNALSGKENPIENRELLEKRKKF